MWRLAIGPVLLAIACALGNISSTNGHMAISLVLLEAALIASVLEAIAAEWNRKVPTWVVAVQTGVPLLFNFPAAIFMSWFVPVAAWLFAVAAIYGLRRAPTAESTVGIAWTRASVLFDKRRTALGKHYRWRVMLATTPYLIYAFCSLFVMAAITGYAVASLGMAGGSPETAVIGAFFGTLALGIAVIVALPAGLGVGGLILSPFVRGPYINLLRALWPKPLPDEQLGLGCATSLVLLIVDMAVVFIAFTWAGSTLIGSAFPGGGSTASLVQLPVLVGALSLRVLLGDAFLMHAGHPLKSPWDVIKAVMIAPLSMLQTATFQVGVMMWFFAVPMLVGACATLIVAVEFPSSTPYTLGLAVIGLLALAYLGAATSLRLALHRLVLLDDILSEPAATVSATVELE